MSLNRDDLLVLIYESHLGVLEVSDTPKSVLKKLAAECMIEVETRRCSTWHFGARVPDWRLSPRYAGNASDRAEYDRQNRAYEMDQSDREQTVWGDRTEIFARITPKGVEYLESIGLLP